MLPRGTGAGKQRDGVWKAEVLRWEETGVTERATCGGIGLVMTSTHLVILWVNHRCFTLHGNSFCQQKVNAGIQGEVR